MQMTLTRTVAAMLNVDVCEICVNTQMYMYVLTALTLMVERQEMHAARKNFCFKTLTKPLCGDCGYCYSSWWLMQMGEFSVVL